MSYDSFLYDDIKHKIRKLKKLEMKIRFGSADMPQCPAGRRLMWDEFFSFRESKTGDGSVSYDRRRLSSRTGGKSDFGRPDSGNTGKAKYTLGQLFKMNKDEYRNVIDEFFFCVYYRYYKENGFTGINIYDPEMLSRLGLPYDADYSTIKARFRELAKKCHPDTGGDPEKFIEMMENFRKLME